MQRVHINTYPASPAPDKYMQALFRRRKCVYKYFSFAGKVFLNTSQASPAQVSDKLYIYKYFSGAGELFKYTSPAPEKPGKYLKTPLPAPEKYLYTLFRAGALRICTLFGAGEA